MNNMYAIRAANLGAIIADMDAIEVEQSAATKDAIREMQWQRYQSRIASQAGSKPQE